MTMIWKDPQFEATDANEARLMLLSLCNVDGAPIQCHLSKFPDSYPVRHILSPKKLKAHNLSTRKQSSLRCLFFEQA